MKAEEARKITSDALNGPATEKQMVSIFASIKNAAQEGKKQVQLLSFGPGHIENFVKSKLKELGYLVEFVDNYDPRDTRESSYYTISW